jgi:F-type H+-transporting ATPase subunit a
VSLNVLGAISLAAEGGEGEGFHAPEPAEFYQPLIGHGDFAITRPMVVLAISVALIAWFLVATTKRAAIIPGRGQWVTEGAYNFVRNGVARDIIGSRDFLKFVPLLFSMFMLILVNNLFGIIPPIQYPTMSRIGFPIALTL